MGGEGHTKIGTDKDLVGRFKCLDLRLKTKNNEIYTETAVSWQKELGHWHCSFGYCHCTSPNNLSRDNPRSLGTSTETGLRSPELSHSLFTRMAHDSEILDPNWLLVLPLGQHLRVDKIQRR